MRCLRSNRPKARREAAEALLPAPATAPAAAHSPPQRPALRPPRAGALALSAAEALLPVQGCIAVLGPRLKAAALHGILQLCTQAMRRG